MTLGDLVARVSDLRPSEFGQNDLTQWVNEVEFMAIDKVFSRFVGPVSFTPYVYDTDCEQTLLIPDQFNGVYTAYLFSKIDWSNAEAERNNLDALSFDSEWNEFASYYRRKFRPRNSHATPLHNASPV